MDFIWTALVCQTICNHFKLFHRVHSHIIKHLCNYTNQMHNIYSCRRNTVNVYIVYILCIWLVSLKKYLIIFNHILISKPECSWIVSYGIQCLVLFNDRACKLNSTLNWHSFWQSVVLQVVHLRNCLQLVPKHTCFILCAITRYG